MKPSRELLVKALKELPTEDILERLETYGRNSHFGSPSENVWIEFKKWIDKYNVVLLELK